MRSQASAALGVVLIWLITNNLALTAVVVAADLGERTEEILFKEANPIIGQLALVALVASAVIWLTGGLLRKALSAVAAAVLGYLSFLTISLVISPEQRVADQISLTGEIARIDFGLTSYLLILISTISALLYLGSIKTYSADKAQRPRLKSDRDTWRAQDEGKDDTV